MDNSIISNNILEFGFEYAMTSHILETNFDHSGFKSIIQQMIASKINIVIKPSSNIHHDTWEKSTDN